MYNFMVKNSQKILIYSWSLILFLIDRIVKVLILNAGNIYYQRVIIKNFFYLTLTKNTGAAFSILENYTFIFVIIAILFLIYIDKSVLKEKLNKLERISFSMLIGGILGNMFDRILYGYVIDYFDFRIFSYNFPIFNFADVFIVVGAIILIINLIKGTNNN